MSENEQKVAIVTGGSQVIGAGIVAGYRDQGWAVVANALTIKPTDDPGMPSPGAEVSAFRGSRQAAAGREQEPSTLVWVQFPGRGS